jgi:hypothetical protein
MLFWTSCCVSSLTNRVLPELLMRGPIGFGIFHFFYTSLLYGGIRIWTNVALVDAAEQRGPAPSDRDMAGGAGRGSSREQAVGCLPGARGRPGPTTKAAFAAERGSSWPWASAGWCVPGPFPLLLRACRDKDCIVKELVASASYP